jgi:ferredoxin
MANTLESAGALPSATRENVGFALEQSAPSWQRAPHRIPTRPVPAAEVLPNDEQWTRLRQFHIGNERAGDDLETIESCLPALLSPYAEDVRLRFDFPLLLHMVLPVDDPGDIATPLSEFLVSAVAAIDGEPAGQRILRDNLARFERTIQGALAQSSAPVAAKPLLLEAGERMQDELALSAENRAQLTEALTQVAAGISPETGLLGYGPRAAVYLLMHTIRHALIPKRLQFAETVAGLAEQLRALLSLEWAQSQADQDPRHIEGRVGAAGAQFLDAAALGRVMHHARGPQRMSPEHRGHVAHALKILEGFLDSRTVRLMTIIDTGELAREPACPTQSLVWQERSYACEFQAGALACSEANKAFDSAAQELAPVFSAMRTARLTIAGQDDPRAHDSASQVLSWENFSESELQLVPMVVAVTRAEAVAAQELADLSRLLRSHRPVQILVTVDPANDPGTEEQNNDVPPGKRLELGYFGVSHRHAWVNQSTAARPRHLIAGFQSAIKAARPGLHVLLSEAGQKPNAPQYLHPWLVAGSAIEGRGHCLFHFAPPGAAHSRYPAQALRSGQVDLQDNPQPEQDWPVYALPYRERDGTEHSLLLPFTFVDFAVLHSALAHQLRLIPEGVQGESLLPVAAYLSLPAAEAAKHLPYIWLVDPDGGFRRAVPTRDLLIKAKDRLDYWRTLQADAGVRNAFVEQARHEATAQAEQDAQHQREQLQESFQVELARVRQETARNIMSRLTEVLLGLDLTGDAPAGAACAASSPDIAAAAPPARPCATQPAATEEQGSELDDPVIEEAWIDTALCTSCNDCININPRLFVYDENKQARIGDSRAGTYVQLVEAAEKCPARCVHPGQPLDPDEAGVDALVVRAAPFN